MSTDCSYIQGIFYRDLGGGLTEFAGKDSPPTLIPFEKLHPAWDM